MARRQAFFVGVSRGRFGLLAVLYALVLCYAMTVPSPLGFAPRDISFEQALQTLLDVRYVELGSDQQADWMANLLALVPLGFMLTIALTPRWRRVDQVLGAIGALVLCVAYVLGVKFAQVFFPRTVDLNYIIAQTIGAALGVVVGLAGRGAVEAAAARLRRRGPESLVVVLAAASAGILAFMLVPFDFTLTPADVVARLDALPGLLFQVPGADRPGAMRAGMLAAGMVGVMPIGMLLALLQPYRSLALIAVQALLLMTAVTGAAMFVMSASPSLLNIPARSVFVVLGAVLLRWLRLHDIGRRRGLVRALLLLLIPPYLLALVLVNGLLPPQWRGFDAALASIDPRFFIPLWTHYIVTKAQATRSELAQIAIYAPVGVFLWAAGCSGRRCPWIAAGLALLLSSAVEYARWMKPGQGLDINNPPIAAAAAALAALATPFLWDVLRSLAVSRPRSFAAR